MNNLKKLVRQTLRENSGGLKTQAELKAMDLGDLEEEEEYVMHMMHAAAESGQRANLHTYLQLVRDTMDGKYTEMGM